MQIDRMIERVSLEAAIADQRVRQLEKEREAATRGQTSHFFARRRKAGREALFSQKIGSDFQVAEKLSAVEFKNLFHNVIRRPHDAVRPGGSHFGV